MTNLLLLMVCTSMLSPAQATQPAEAGGSPVAVEQASGYLPVDPEMPPGSAPAVPAEASQAEKGPTLHPLPGAWFAEKPRKTFFVYEHAVPAGSGEATACLAVGAFDHQESVALQPVLLPFRGEHVRASLTLDERGHLWMLAASGAADRATQLFKSTKPYEIDEFTRFDGPAHELAQFWAPMGGQLMALGIKPHESAGHPVFTVTDTPGEWQQPQPLSVLEGDHQLVTGQHRTKIGAAVRGPVVRGNSGEGTSLYYLETSDGGKTWQTMRRAAVALPLKQPDSPTLVKDYASIAWRLHLKDITFDKFGNPTILYIVVRGGTNGAPAIRTWTTARWIGREWESTGVLPADGEADHGRLYVEPDRSWRLLITTEAAGPGTRLTEWFSDDQGRSWYRQFDARLGKLGPMGLQKPVHSNPGLYAFWTGTGPGAVDAARIYFTTREGRLFLLPVEMDKPAQPPVSLPAATTTAAPARTQ